MSQKFVAKKMFPNRGCLFSSSTSATFGGNFCRNKSCWFGGYHTLPICEKKSATEYLKGFRISVGYIILISTKNYRRKIFFRACFLLSRTPSRGRLFCILFSLRIVYGLPFIWPHRLMFLAKGLVIILLANIHSSRKLLWYDYHPNKRFHDYHRGVGKASKTALGKGA